MQLMPTIGLAASHPSLLPLGCLPRSVDCVRLPPLGERKLQIMPLQPALSTAVVEAGEGWEREVDRRQNG